MSDQHSPHTPHTAQVQANKRISGIWFIPFLALCIGLFMVLQQWHNQGTLVTIEMHSAEGLEANKTKIKTHNVDVGMVTTIELNNNNDGVVVKARINKDLEHLLVEDTQMWVVSPRISNSGVSGLGTLLSGVYIELAPGSKPESKTHFIALENPPVTPTGTPGLSITLTSKNKINYSIGDSVSYHGLTVGKFEGVDFDIHTKTVSYAVFIEAPYHQLITDKTQFWNTTGLDVNISAKGINIKTESLQSLLTSGVAFDDLDESAPGKPIDNSAVFTIYESKETASAPTYQHAVSYTLLVSSSIRGLNIGAPVEFRGINIGEVTAINTLTRTEESLLSQDYRIPVKIKIEPGRIGLDDSKLTTKNMLRNMKVLVAKGLRAKLKSANILTGQLFVDLQIYPDLPVENLTYFEDSPVIPVILDDFSSLSDNANKFIVKLNQLPLETLSNNLNDTLIALNSSAETLAKIMHDVDQKEIVSNLSSTISSTQKLADSYSAGSASYQELIASLSQLEAVLRAAENLASSYSEGSDNYDNVGQTLERLNSLMIELQPLLLNLNQTPNSLIFSGQQPADIEPKARK